MLRALVCVGCVCATVTRGPGRGALRSPRGPDSRLVPLHFPERIVFFLSEEERPTHRETGPKRWENT